MKPFFLIIFSFFAINSISKAQSPVVDTHPASTIFAIDYSTGQEAPAMGDQAILFKDAFIDLVSNTNAAKMYRLVPGHKSFVVTQLDPQANGNAYQLILQNKFLSQVTTVYTFVYNVDQNTLSFYNPPTQSYSLVSVVGFNLNNLNNCSTYGKFNNFQPAPTTTDATVQPAMAAVDTDVPVDAVDANVTATIQPPALPENDPQPECPVDGYLWQPGFWSYSADGGYYYVPGSWVAPPNPGLLWTPPYWGFDGGIYAFHAGYWGPTIGFYGGVNYGYGYAGSGFVGGRWDGGYFRYNTAVLRVNTVVVRNTYVDNTVVYKGERNRAAFNGRGGVVATPNERERAAMNEHHVMATAEQNRNQHLARADKSAFAKNNGGRPANVAVARVPERGPGTGGMRPKTNVPPGPNGPKTNVPPGPKPPVKKGGLFKSPPKPNIPKKKS